MIDRNLINKGLRDGVIKLVSDPHATNGVVCQIGEFWFYFGGEEAECMSPAEYESVVPRSDIVREICETLEGFRAAPEFADEYKYYAAIIKQAFPK